MNTIKTLVIRFSNTITKQEIPLFRGAVINSGLQDNILFHNHQGDNFRYSYPLIQYKRLHGKAAILCVGEGTEAIGELFSNQHFEYQIGKQAVTADIENVSAHQTTIECDEKPFYYDLYSWLALNSTNYAIYKSMESLSGRVEMLENILTGNILSFLKGVDIHMDSPIKVCISNINKESVAKYKGVVLSSFDISFSTNLRLPYFIGLGKGASTGFGVLEINHKNKS